MVNSIINYQNSGGPIVYDFIVTQTEDAVIEAVINRDDFDTMCQNWLNDIFDGAGSLGTLMYYDKNGETDYVYALNHVPGMAYSLMYILKNIDSLSY